MLRSNVNESSPWPVHAISSGRSGCVTQSLKRLSGNRTDSTHPAPWPTKSLPCQLNWYHNRGTKRGKLRGSPDQDKTENLSFVPKQSQLPELP
jgi:hypothetical protein